MKQFDFSNTWQVQDMTREEAGWETASEPTIQSIVFRPKNGKQAKEFIKFLNFCQIRLEPPENKNQKVPRAKGGA